MILGEEFDGESARSLIQYDDIPYELRLELLPANRYFRIYRSHR